jgi:hypothetical protein
MLDGIDLKGRTNVVALGITTDGVTLPLGLWEGSSEHAAVATALLARSSRNVKRRQNGDMALRWTAAGMLEAEQQFRRIIGHADLAKLPSRSSATSPATARPTLTTRPRTPLPSSPNRHTTRRWGRAPAPWPRLRESLVRPRRRLD